MDNAIFSTMIRSGRTTYFVDVKEAKNGKKYLSITETRIDDEGKKDRSRDTDLRRIMRIFQAGCRRGHSSNQPIGGRPMQIDKRYKIEKVVSKDPTRENLQNIHVTKRHAFATDGRILAAVPVQTDSDDTEGWMTPDALKIGRKCSAGDTVTHRTQRNPEAG